MEAAPMFDLGMVEMVAVAVLAGPLGGPLAAAFAPAIGLAAVAAALL